MKEVLKHIELIENFVEGKLSENERKDFETRLIVDGDFKEEFDLYKSVVAGIKASGLENLKAKMKEADYELDSNNVVELKFAKKQNSRLYYSIAASIVLILGIAFIWNFNSGNSLSDLADSVYEKDKGLPVEMSVNIQTLNDAMNSYKTGDYHTAQNHLLNILHNNQANDTTIFYLGLVEYELGNFIKSQEYFNAISDSSIYCPKAEYRLLLSLLKINSVNDAKAECKKILSNPNHQYREKAELISKKLFSESEK